MNSGKQKHHSFHKNIKQHNCFNINNKKKMECFFLSPKLGY